MKVEFKFSGAKFSKRLQQNIYASIPKIVDALSHEIEINARRNFDNAVDEISGDNPYVVVSRVVSNYKASVICQGEQVLFAEFGAGVENSYKEITSRIGEHTRTSSKGTVYRVNAYDRTMVYGVGGFKSTFKGMVETIPRPSGIVPLGEYGKKLGRNDMWVRPTTNGRMAEGQEFPVHASKGGHRTDVVWTRGTRPLRCLWKARNTAIAKYRSGRLNIK